MAAQCCTSRIFAFRGYFFSAHSFSAISENITIIHTWPKTRYFGLHSCCEQYRLNFNHCDVIGPKATEFSKITHNNGHNAARGHSKSPLLVPIEIIRNNNNDTYIAQIRKVQQMQQKPVDDFLCLCNTNLSPILHRFQYVAIFGLCDTSSGDI